MLNANVESNTTLFVVKAEPAWLGPPKSAAALAAFRYA